jgi:ribonuclease P protein component
VGFTVPRALGGSVIRNRIKRRMREAVRSRLSALGPGWCIVFNPRRAALEAPLTALTREVDRLFSRCNG